MSDKICLPLRPDWMRRPYFGPERIEPKPGESQEAPPKGWVKDGMRCTALPGFLLEPTAGLFLVAGPRGIGKTSMVRHCLGTAARQDTGKRQNAADSQDVTYHLVDAADLGLYESVDAKRLERVLLEGLFRALCERLIEIEYRGRLFTNAATPWLRRLFSPLKWLSEHAGPKWLRSRFDELVKILERRLPPSEDKAEFWRDLYSLAERASADSHERRQEDGNTGSAEISGTLASHGIGFKGLGKWVRKRSTQSVWTNRTDALRAEFRALLLRHKNKDWPVLVLDEWDRFGDKHDNKVPSVEHALQALARLKSLLADYPAAVVVVGGEELYCRVRLATPSAQTPGAPSHESEIPLEEPSGYANIFNQRCFLSPLPAWADHNPAADNDAIEEEDREPLLYPYLLSLLDTEKIELTKEEEADARKLAYLLLLEVGPDPHGLKLWVGRNLSADGRCLAPPWDTHSEVKVLMSQVVAKELERWERRYGAILTAGPHRRLIWLRYLRERMFAYWRHVRPRGAELLCFPRIERHRTEIAPLEFLGQLEQSMEDRSAAPSGTAANADTSHWLSSAAMPPGRSDAHDSVQDFEERARLQRLDLDARLLGDLYNRVRRTCLERGRGEELAELVQIDESAGWEDWVRDGLFPWWPKRPDKTDLMRGMTCYDLRGLKQR